VSPWRVWLVVVFVSAFSFLGYVPTEIAGPEKGIGLTGLLGGCIASTPTVVSMAEQAKRNPEIDSLYAFGALLTSIAMIGKVFAIIVVVTPHFASAVVIPFLGMLVVGVLFAFLVLRRYKATKPTDNRVRQPIQSEARTRIRSNSRIHPPRSQRLERKCLSGLCGDKCRYSCSCEYLFQSCHRISWRNELHGTDVHRVANSECISRGWFRHNVLRITHWNSSLISTSKKEETS
jgi:hypothetical protein